MSSEKWFAWWPDEVTDFERIVKFMELLEFLGVNRYWLVTIPDSERLRARCERQQ